MRLISGVTPQFLSGPNRSARTWGHIEIEHAGRHHEMAATGTQIRQLAQ